MDKVVYITGGTKGIGLGIARVLLAEGCKVAVSGRSIEAAVAAAASLSADTTKVLAVESDVRNPEDEQKAIAAVLAYFGRVDVVIANAGLGNFASVDELSVEEWKDMIDTNLSGAFYTLKASIDGLKQTQGYFITIASLAGAYFFENAAGYNASKFGVVGFTQAAMLDLRKHHIKTSVIMPGSVDTYFNNNEPGESGAWKIQPDDVGDVVAGILKMNPRALPSKIELRPTLPPKK